MTNSEANEPSGAKYRPESAEVFCKECGASVSSRKSQAQLTEKTNAQGYKLERRLSDDCDHVNYRIATFIDVPPADRFVPPHDAART